MKRTHCYEDMSLLIYQEQIEGLTPEETRLLEEWKLEKESNRALYEKMVAKNDWSNEIQRYAQIDTNAAWKKYIRRYVSHGRRRSLFLRVSATVSIAASILLAIILFRNHSQHDIVTTIAHHAKPINPGTSSATLILDDGKPVDLSASKNRAIDIRNNITAINTGSQISYSSNEKNNAPTECSERYNTIVVPRAGEYKIILSDGTSVWLNAQTSLKYPVRFSGETRTVYLQGEAYFDVKTDKEKPFIVALQNDVTIRVIGTAFNIRNYLTEGKIQTTLEEGKVEMKTSEGKYSMTPNMIAEYDKETHQTSLQSGNTEFYTAWRQGRYVFHDETLINIFRRLADWYDINIIYENENIKHKRYSGNVMRHETVNELLNAIEESGGVRFGIDGKTVRVFSAK